MHILYIHQYFNTPEESGGTRSYWIARRLIERGHKVVMLTSTRDGREAGRRTIDGIDTIYIRNDYSQYMSPWRKVWSFIRFIAIAFAKAYKEKGIDLVYATSTPLTVGFLALCLKMLKGRQYFFEVRDLWPEFPIQIGAIRNRFLICLLRWLERKIYENAEHIVALSPGMKEGVIAAGIPGEKVSMIPNMSKPDIFYPHSVNEETEEKFGIDRGRFNVIHFGAMGKANGLTYIIEAAKILKEHGDDSICFLFLGRGAIEPMLRAKTDEYGLSNVKFIGDCAMRETAEIVNCCDASIVSFLNLPILQTNSPNKFFDSLSAGKPIIVNSAGWTKDIVEKENCGLYADPTNPEDLADKILKMKEDKGLLTEWSANSLRLALERFDKAILTDKVADIVDEYTSSGKRQ